MPLRMYVPLSLRVPAARMCVLGEAHRSVVPWNEDAKLVPRSVRARADSLKEASFSGLGMPVTLTIPN